LLVAQLLAVSLVGDGGGAGRDAAVGVGPPPTGTAAVGAATGIGWAGADGVAPGAGAVAAAGAGPGDGDGDAATAAAVRFLDRYVADDGRVVRHDQGGDTVSEGQAYGLLAAVGVGDRARFDRIWWWTTTHLRRDDALLAWRWADGTVVDEQSATDADLAAAWALALAAARWADGRDAYAGAATELVGAIVDHEVGRVDGQPVLLAGPWAGGDVPVLNPSYASPAAADVLVGVVGGDDAAALDVAVDGLVERTAELLAPSDLDGNLGQPHGEPGSSGAAGGSTDDRATASAADGGGDGSTGGSLAAGVAPDWAVADDEGGVEAVRGPREDGGGRFGWDAVRVPLWLAAACDPSSRELAAAHSPAIEDGAAVHRLGDHPARLVGAAGAALADGGHDRAVALLDAAAASDGDDPTYYGAALVAVGRLLLETTALGGCSPLTA
jgi:endoglucanase